MHKGKGLQKGEVEFRHDLFTTWQAPVQYRLVLPLGAPHLAPLRALQAGIPGLGEMGGMDSQDGHIEVASFSAPAAQASTIIRWLQRLLQTQQAFSLILNNFSGVPPHRLYMRVMGTAEVMQLRALLQQLSQYLHDYSLPLLDQPQRWMLPLAEGLPGMWYDKALRQLAHTDLALEAPVTQMLLEKRCAPEQPWQLVQRFHFQDPPFISLQPWFTPCRAVQVY
jgi:hypothetical protein